jgi:hypothetical protein
VVGYRPPSSPNFLEREMMKPKDNLPGVAILMLDMALSSLDRAAEAQSIEIAREKISEAQKETTKC